MMKENSSFKSMVSRCAFDYDVFDLAVFSFDSKLERGVFECCLIAVVLDFSDSFLWNRVKPNSPSHFSTFAGICPEKNHVKTQPLPFLKSSIISSSVSYFPQTSFSLCLQALNLQYIIYFRLAPSCFRCERCFFHVAFHSSTMRFNLSLRLLLFGGLNDISHLLHVSNFYPRIWRVFSLLNLIDKVKLNLTN